MKNISLMKTKQLLRLLLVVFCALFVGVFAVMIKSGHTFLLDQKFINGTYRIREGWLTVVVKIFTNFASIYSVALITLLIVLFMKDIKIKIFAVFNIAVTSLTNIVLKNIIKRPRPDVVALITETGYSFPSGHSMIAIAMFGFLAYIIYRYMKNKYLKFFLASFSCVVGVLIALSRVYLGVHYFTDIVCGMVMGLATLVISIMGHKAMIMLEYKRKTKGENK